MVNDLAFFGAQR